ncbi:transcriptional regulator [Leuconostoc mesenteroides]|uniref:winged helix-turn-helix transcriptional regulator n=2 Tax=Leuconostoc mesenteroides TaxID=1245 RepID=UPI0021BFE4D4|nr:helix-turn-helix domain-containing protein [Leuconostoc mesenteroides]MCT8383686.1 transcriptional regulator [Leuconostoc mesenteroides]
MSRKLLEQNGICPVATTIDLLSSKWKVLIIRDLLPGTKRFSELKISVAGISQKMLTQSLREMEEDGLVVRQVFAVVPLKVEYSLSTLGQSMRPVIDSMADWGSFYLDENPDKRKALTVINDPMIIKDKINVMDF